MSDELIKVPSYLAVATMTGVKPAACGFCTEVACETDAMTCGQCSGQSCSGQCTAAECSQCSSCQSSCESSCQVNCQGCEGGCQSTQVSPPTSYGTISVQSTTANSIDIRLVAISGATSYVVAYREDGTSNTQTWETSNLTTTIPGLTPATTYVLNYYGKNSGGTGPYMPSGVRATTLPETLVEPWTWNASNGSATAAQTKAAYNAVQTKGSTSDFSYLVWNDMVDKVLAILSAQGGSWSDLYATASQTKMSSTNKILTATRFNALRQNIGSRVATGIQEVSTGDIVHGSYFITLASKINEWISTI